MDPNSLFPQKIDQQRALVMKHIVIIPARDEEDNIETTVRSLLHQYRKPHRVYVVDDGSSDRTPDIVEGIAAEDPTVVLLRNPDRGYRKMGGGVVDVFHFGYDQCKHEEFTYISKIDSDLTFPPEYFSTLLAYMDENPNCAAGSGLIYDLIGSSRERLRFPSGGVPGPVKTIRKSVFDEIGGFQRTLGWDVIDTVHMRSLGYETVTLTSIEVTHRRQHGSAEGIYRGKATWGKGAWAIGSHPLFIAGRGVYRMLEPPYVTGGFAFWYGYIRAALQGYPQIPNKDIIRALRKEQLTRLLNGNKIPRGKAVDYPVVTQPTSG